MMTKIDKKAKKISPKEIEKAFMIWNKTLDAMKDKANESYMPLLGDLFEYGKKVLDMYKKAYLIMEKSR